MQLQLVVNMETATIEQLHRLQQQQIKGVDRLPVLRRVSFYYYILHLLFK